MAKTYLLEGFAHGSWSMMITAESKEEAAAKFDELANEADFHCDLDEVQDVSVDNITEMLG